MEYCISGQIMIDTVVYADGSDNGINLGGPAAFGFAGVKLWTDDVMMNINVGEDFYGYFDEWLNSYNAFRECIHVINPHGNRHIITYKNDGSYHEDSVYGWDNMHKMDPRIEDYEQPCCDNLKGAYLNNNANCVDFWRGMEQIRKTKGIKTMWEIPTGDVVPEKMDLLTEIFSLTDYMSINVNEGKTLWNVDTEQQVVQNCLKLPLEMIFLRAGERGAYVIAQNRAVFVPSVEREDVVDPTGCGNCSTAVAMYAYTHTKDPVLTCAMANISASYNLRQNGPYPGYSQADRDEAWRLLNEIMEEYRK